jgi:hypothetical protein
MPILLKNGAGNLVIQSARFADEAELQNVLAQTPALIGRPSDPPLAYVYREVQLPEAGLLDLLFVTSTGLPVATEVKLARNGESRRQIVAQVIDYVSSLTQLTVDELDDVVQGALETALRELQPQYAPNSFDQVWQQVGANLRAGLARVVLVLDEAPPELERIMRFLAERSSLDVRLVVVAKYLHETAGTLYVPNFIVDASEERPPIPPSAATRRPPLSFEELQQEAKQHGVGELFGQLVSGLEPWLQKQPTRSTVSFTGPFGNSRKVVFTVLPGESNATNGLRYKAYTERLKVLFGLSDDNLASMLPANQEDWIYNGTDATPDSFGVQGYFANEADVAKFLQDLARRHEKSDTQG